MLPGGRKEGKTRTDRKHARRGAESLWQETARTACEEAKLIAMVIVERKASQSPAKTLNCEREKQKTLRRAKANSTETVQEALDVPSYVTELPTHLFRISFQVTKRENKEMPTVNISFT